MHVHRLEVRLLGPNPLPTSYDLSKLLYFLLFQGPLVLHGDISMVSPPFFKDFLELDELYVLCVQDNACYNEEFKFHLE